MQRSNVTSTLSWAVLMAASGALGGLLIADSTRARMNGQNSPPAIADPVDRYGLGQNAYETPSVEPARTYQLLPINQHFEHGQYVNGARVLVPGESALKAERLRMAMQDRWHAEYFGVDDTDYSYAPDYYDGFDQPQDIAEVQKLSAAAAPVSRSVQSAPANRQKTAAQRLNEQEAERIRHIRKRTQYASAARN